MGQKAWIQHFFDDTTHTYSYVVTDRATQKCAIIDSVLDFDQASATVSTKNADLMIEYVQKHDLSVEWILETHVHADHLTASQYLKKQLGGKVAISKKIELVQKTFGFIYHLDFKAINAEQPFDHLFEDGEAFSIGELDAYNIPTPGHTPACLSYVVGDAVFIGDTLFMPDYGSARCDFPNGSAAELFDSVQRLYTLPDQTRVFLCHDYLPEGREQFQFETSISIQKNQNIHINTATHKEDFVSLRQNRDAKLGMPRLILPAIQINVQAGHMPKPEENGIAYLKLPLNYFTPHR